MYFIRRIENRSHKKLSEEFREHEEVENQKEALEELVYILASIRVAAKLTGSSFEEVRVKSRKTQ